MDHWLIKFLILCGVVFVVFTLRTRGPDWIRRSGSRAEPRRDEGTPADNDPRPE